MAHVFSHDLLISFDNRHIVGQPDDQKESRAFCGRLKWGANWRISHRFAPKIGGFSETYLGDFGVLLAHQFCFRLMRLLRVRISPELAQSYPVVVAV